MAHPADPSDAEVLGATTDTDPDTTIPPDRAGTGGTPRPRRRRAVLAGAAAVVVVIAVLVTLVAVRDDGAGTPTGSAKAHAPKGDLGDVGSLDRQGVDALVNGGAGTTPASTGSPTPSADGFTERAGAVAPARVKACAERFATGGTVRFQASGDFQGQPAVILGVDTATRTIVFVVAADDCATVLYSASR